MIEVAILVGAYFLGAIPFGYLVGRAMGVDVTAIGSKNIGATNVGRTLGKGPAAVVLLLDVIKGALPCLVAPLLLPSGAWGLSGPEFGLIAGVIAVLGHIFSPFLGFKGGKGVATGLGLLVGSQPLVAGIALFVFGIVFAFSRIVSLGSLIAVVAMVISAVVLQLSIPYLVVFGLLAAFVVFKHRENVGRLMRGEEKRFEFGRKEVKSGEPAASDEQSSA